MTVLIYVNTSKQVGDAEHLKVFANADAAETWFEENDPKVRHSNMRSWSETRQTGVASEHAEPRSKQSVRPLQQSGLPTQRRIGRQQFSG